MPGNMIISKQKQFIFVSVPKTGTTSIEKVLSKYEDVEVDLHYKKHAPFHEVEYLGLDYYKFCFFRNPWDQFVSMYQYHHDSGHCYLGINYRDLSFDEYLKVAMLSEEYAIKVQIYYLTNNDGFLPDIHVFKFEDMEASWKCICEKLQFDAKLPHLNKSTHSHYSTYYTDETKNLIAERCKLEIKLMGYKFEEK